MTVDSRTDLFTRAETLIDTAEKGERPLNPRQRIERIITAHPNTGEVSSTGGGSPIMVVNERGRLKETVSGPVTAHYLRRHDGSGDKFAIYPFGIQGVSGLGAPLFYPPDKNTMRSVVFMPGDQYHADRGWLMEYVDPLFNIDTDGTVLRGADPSTPEELAFLDELLGEFESAGRVNQV
jgi:hypothetical protein